MLMTNESISILIYCTDGQLENLGRTIRVWDKVCSSYSPGAEVVICAGTNSGDPSELESFIDGYSGEVKYVLRMSDDTNVDSAAALFDVLGFVTGKFGLIVNGSTYPNGYILPYAGPFDELSVNLGVRKLVPSPFSHSALVDDATTMSDPYKKLSGVPLDQCVALLHSNGVLIPMAVFVDVMAYIAGESDSPTQITANYNRRMQFLTATNH